MTCANGVSPESKQYSYASVPKDSDINKNKAKSSNFYSVEDKCGESLPADYYTANRIIDLHNQYRSQVSQKLPLREFLNDYIFKHAQIFKAFL